MRGRAGSSFEQARKQADRAGAEGQRLGSRVARGARAASLAADKTGRAMTLGISVPVTALGVAAVRTFANFERSIVSAGSKSGATAGQLDLMKKAALEVGNSTKFSATQAATAMDQLAAAGFNANDAIATLPAVTLAAQAANEDLGLTASVTAKAMNAFNIPVEKASHVADVFSQAANTTAIDMQGLKDALGQVGEVGPRFNQSLEDVVAVTGRLVDLGVPAASAGTAIRQALTSLSAPTDRAAGLMAQLGLKTRDANGQMLPLPDLLQNVQTALADGSPEVAKFSKLTKLSDDELKEWAKSHSMTTRSAMPLRTAMREGSGAVRDYALKTLFGVEGSKAFALAMSQGKPVTLDAVRDQQKLVDVTNGLAQTMGTDAARAFVAARTENGKFTASGVDAIRVVSALAKESDGTAKAIGAAFQRTTAQKIDNLKGSVETLAIVLVDRLAPGINDTTDKLTKFVTGLSDAAQGNPILTKLVLGFVGVAAAIGPALFVGAKFVGMISTVTSGVTATRKALDTGITYLQLYGEAATNSGKRVRGGLLSSLAGTASFLTGPWGIAIAIGATALLGWIDHQRQAKKESEAFTSTLTFQNGALDDNSRSLTANQLAKDGTLQAAVKAGISEKAFTDALINGGDARTQMAEQLRLISLRHTRTVNTGQSLITTTDATGKAADKAREQLLAMGGGLDKQKAAAEAAKNALGPAADAAGDLASNVGAAGSAADAASPPVQELADANAELSAAAGEVDRRMQSLNSEFTILKDGALDSSAASDSFKRKLLELSATVKGNSGRLDTNTKKGLDNRDAVRGMVEELNRKIGADFKAGLTTKNLGDKTKVASKAIRSGRKDILDAAEAAGLNRRDVKKMIDQMLLTPEELKTKVDAPGMTDVQKQIKELKKRIKELESRTVVVTAEMKLKADRALFKKLGIRVAGVNSAGGLVRADGGPVPSSADGGTIKGYGGPRQDNIAGIDRATKRQSVWVSAKEFIVNAVAARRNKKLLRDVNAGKNIPYEGKDADKLADGGHVRSLRDRPQRLRGRPSTSRSVRVDGDYTGTGAMPVGALAKLAQGQLTSYAAGALRREVKAALARKEAADAGLAGGAGPMGTKMSGGIIAIARKFNPSYIAAHRSPEGYPSYDIGSSGSKNAAIGGALRANHARLGLKYIIRQMQITSARSNWRWRRYTPITGAGDFRHVNHVHVSYAKGTHAARNAVSLLGENGPELYRTRAGSQVLTSKKTLDYLSRIEGMAVKAPKDLASTPRTSLGSDQAWPTFEAPTTINMPIYYPQANEIPTMAAQRQLVRAGRAVRRSNRG